MNYFGETIDGQEVLTSKPAIGSFFRPPRGEAWTISKIANAARNNAGLDRSYIYKLTKAIAGSAFNKSHIVYTNKGYENFPFTGPQYFKLYGNSLNATKGTGNQYPVIWIPNPVSLSEPVLKRSAPPVVVPVSPAPVSTPPVPVVATPVPVAPVPVAPAPVAPVPTVPVPVTVTPKPVVTPAPVVVRPAPVVSTPPIVVPVDAGAVSAEIVGPPGPPGPQGPPGAPAVINKDMIIQAVIDYMRNAKISSGVSKQTVEQMIRNAVKNIVGPAGPPAIVDKSMIVDAVFDYMKNARIQSGISRNEAASMISEAMKNLPPSVKAEVGKPASGMSALALLPMVKIMAEL